MIVFVYGEPAGQTVIDRWGGGQMLFHRALADAGYIVVSVDNRGTPAPKGAAWRKVVYGAVGELSREGAGRGRARADGAQPLSSIRPASACGAGAAADRTR